MSKGKILVVDDDPTQRRLIQAVLEREGFAVEDRWLTTREEIDRFKAEGH